MRLLVSLLSLSAMLVARAAAPPLAKWEFAVSLAGTTNGQLFTLFVVKVYDGQVIESIPLSREQFIRQVQGRAFSKANTDAEDLFRKYDVTQCTLPEDSAKMGFLTDCSTLDDLWRLRFWEYPLETQEHPGKGWSAEALKPSPRQMDILKCYGMQYPTDLVIGANLFALLHDMGDPRWVEQYRHGG